MIWQKIKSVISQFLSIAYLFTLCVMTNSNFLCCAITQNGEYSCDLLLSVTNRKELAPGGLFKTFIKLLTVTF